MEKVCDALSKPKVHFVVPHIGFVRSIFSDATLDTPAGLSHLHLDIASSFDSIVKFPCACVMSSTSWKSTSARLSSGTIFRASASVSGTNPWRVKLPCLWKSPPSIAAMFRSFANVNLYTLMTVFVTHTTPTSFTIAGNSVVMRSAFHSLCSKRRFRLFFRPK